MCDTDFYSVEINGDKGLVVTVFFLMTAFLIIFFC